MEHLNSAYIFQNGVRGETSKEHLRETLDMIHERRNFQKKVLLTGETLTIAQVHAVGEVPHTNVSVVESCKQEVIKNAEYLSNKINSGLIVYGVNTGFGGSADVRCLDTVKVQQGLVRHLNAGFGEVLDASIPRSVMLIRANSLSRGMSGVRLEVVQLLCDMIKADIVPLVPKRGSVSASGDLMPSSYIAAAMMGRADCKVLHNGKLTTAPEALADAKLTPVTFINKEALAVLNSSSFADSLGGQVLYRANIAAILTQVAVGMTVEALSGRTESFHPTIHKCMPHPYQMEVASNILSLLQDSKLAVTNLDMDQEDFDGKLKQDRYALRTAAQWLGPAIDQIMRANHTASINLNSTNDNPVIDHHCDKILHGGNFQGTSMTVAMDNCRQGLQLCGKLMFAQMSEMINMTMNNGLPPNLSGSDYSHDFGFKGTDTAMASYMSELDLLTNQVTRHVLSAEMNNQAVNSLALISARWTEQALTVLQQMLANITVCQAQAIDLRWLQQQVTTLLKSCCQKYGLDHNKRMHPHVWRWYDFAFDPVATAQSFVDTVPEITQKAMFVGCVESSIRPLMDSVHAGNHTNKVADSLGQGTRKMYHYVRETLGIKFYQGERSLDTDLQKMYTAIVDRDIEAPLLDIFLSL